MKQLKNTIRPILILAAGIAIGSLTTAMLAQPERAAVKPVGAAYTIDNCVSQLYEGTVKKTAAGFQFWFVPKEFSQGELNLKLSQVNESGANHPPHKHPEEEIFYILDGKAEFNVAGKSKVVGPNTALYCPPGVLHGIQNVGATPLRYLVIKNG